MNPKYLAFYLVAATLAFTMAVYQTFTSYFVLNDGRIMVSLLISLFFYYLAYRIFAEKRDKELIEELILYARIKPQNFLPGSNTQRKPKQSIMVTLMIVTVTLFFTCREYATKAKARLTRDHSDSHEVR